MCENQLEKRLAEQLLFVCLSELPSKQSRWERSQRPLLGMNLNDVRFRGIADMKHRIVSIISAGFDP
jgi:hypothetical protein